MNNITNISIEVLKIHPRNQEFFDDISGEDYERFKTSIREDGVVTPLIVAPDMTIISGHQRTKACIDLGINRVPVIIREDIDNEDEKLKLLLATNFGRTKNDPSKQRKIMTQYVELCGIRKGGNQFSIGEKHLPLKEIAKIFGVSESTLKENLIIERKLTPELKELLDEGKITKSTAHRILARLSPEEQKEILEDLGAEGLSEKTQAQLKEYVSKLQQKEEENQKLKEELEKEKNKPKEKEVIIEEDVASKEELRIERENKIRLLRENEALRKTMQDIEDEKVRLLGEIENIKKDESEKEQLKILQDKIKTLEIDLEHKENMLKTKEKIIENEVGLKDLYQDGFKKYNEIIGTTCDYQSNGDDVGRSMSASLEVVTFITDVEKLLKGQLAPLKYERFLQDVKHNETVKNNVNNLIDLVRDWCNEISDIINDDNGINKDSIIEQSFEITI